MNKNALIPTEAHAHELAAAGLEDIARAYTFYVDNLKFDAVVAGPEDGEMVLLLHGFPEFWYCWKHQIRPLANAGFRVVAPDQRGYNRSDRPQSHKAYKRFKLGKDMLGILDILEPEKVHLVGHDWGGGIAWWLAENHPERFENLVVLNCPHHRAFKQNVLTTPAQLLKSWYMGFFQLPGIAERAIAKDNWSALVKILRTSCRTDAFSDADIEIYRQMWSQPGAATSMLNWYRGIARENWREAEDTQIEVPTLVIWGEQDVALDLSLAQASIEQCQDGRLVTLPEASHWVMQDAPEKVSTLLTTFLTRDVGTYSSLQ